MLMQPGRNANRVDYGAAANTAIDTATRPVMTAASDAYVAWWQQRLEELSPRQLAEHVASLTGDHDRWRREQCLNMNAAENMLSPGVRRLLESDLATRVTEGFPGDKEFPPPRQNEHIDQIEATLVHLTRRLFRCEYVEWRAVNTTMALSIVLFALTQPGDTILAQGLEGGGSMAYHPDGIGGLRQLNVVSLPPAGDFEIDVEAARALARTHRPRVIIVGGSYVLFPYPVRELRAIADEIGATLIYDGAHVSLPIATGTFQDPLREGADIVCASTHKIMTGPVGGLVLTNQREIARRILALSFPAFIQTRDQNKYAATAFAFAEMAAFGRDYANACVNNARVLGAALEAEGFDVLAKERHYTATHQIFLDVATHGAHLVQERCVAANILVHAAHLAGDTERGVRTGIRVSVQEITRRGAKEPHMVAIANWIRRSGLDGESPAIVAAEIEQFVRSLPTVDYAFNV